MSDNTETQDNDGVAAAPQNEARAEASARSRRRALRAALAAEAGYILSVRAG